MAETDPGSCFFVIKAEDLPALNRLGSYPRPQRLEWINRGTDQKLRRTTVEMLIRTLFRGSDARSVVRLHQSSGLRVVFHSELDRLRFAKAFQDACQSMSTEEHPIIAALFERREQAERTAIELHERGITNEALSLLWVDSGIGTDEEGHSTASVAGAVAGGGVVGAMFGVAILAIPGIGPLFAAGAIAASAIPTVTTLSAVLGATGGAIARLLTDQDIDSREALYYEEEIVHGAVFVLVDCRLADCDSDTIRSIISRNGGKHRQFERE